MKLLTPSLWKRFHLLATASLLATLANAAWASVGQFQFVSGDVRIVAPDGRERPAQKGGEINQGESVVSAKGASAQLRMLDGGILAIRQDTQMRIDEFRFNGQEDGSERSFFSLVKGGFRSITGTVGKLHKENYRIKTPSATIGIRGTDSETIHITPASEHLATTPAGTYNRVNTGATIVNGTLTLPNQVAYAPSLNAPGIVLPKTPPIFEPPKPSSKPEALKPERKGEAPAATREPAPSSPPPPPTTTTEAPPPPPVEPPLALTSAALPPPPGPTTTLVGTTAATGGVITSTTYAAPLGYGGVGGDISWRTECGIGGGCFTGWMSGGGSVVLESNATSSILLNSSGFPVLIAITDAFGSMQYTAGSAALLDSGQAAVAGTTVSWGRYVGADAFVDSMGTRDPLVMNLMWANSALSAAQAQAALTGTSALTFNLVSTAGTVTDELNNVYHLVNGSLHVLAGGSSMTLNVTTDTVANRSWDLTYQATTGALSQFYQQTTSTTGPSGLPLVNGSIKVGGTIAATTVKGQASGVLIGPAATGALTSFSATAPPDTGGLLPSGAALSGTALLVR